MKYRQLLILPFISTLFSCDEPVKEKAKKPELFYVMHHGAVDAKDSLQQDTSLHWYAYINFVLGDSGRIFYHSKFRECDEKLLQEKPPYLRLLPGDFLEIQPESLQLFLQLNVPDTNETGQRTSAIIAYRTDTITNPAFRVITKYFKSENIKSFAIRRWTEEEQFALTAGLNHATYKTDTLGFKVGFCDRSSSK